MSPFHTGSRGSSGSDATYLSRSRSGRDRGQDAITIPAGLLFESSHQTVNHSPARAQRALFTTSRRASDLSQRGVGRGGRASPPELDIALVQQASALPPVPPRSASATTLARQVGWSCLCST